MDPSSRTNGYISFCRRGRAHDSTVESRFRDIQTRTRMYQAPSHTSRVRTITVGRLPQVARRVGLLEDGQEVLVHRSWHRY